MSRSTITATFAKRPSETRRYGDAFNPDARGAAAVNRGPGFKV